MDAGTLGAIDGFMGFLGNLITNQFNAENVDSTNATNRYLAKYGYEQQKQMIREQNEYNSPLQQMKRYSEAGLNPNLIYGNGSSSVGNQSQIAQYHAPTMQAYQGDFGNLGVADAIGAFLQLKQLELQNKKTEAEVQSMDYRNQLLQRYTKRQDAELTYYNLLHSDGKDSPAFQDYAAGIRLKNQQLDLGELEKGYKTAITIGQKLSNQEKSFYNRNLLPLIVEAKKMELEGMSYDNIIKRIDSETERLFRITGISSNPFRAAAAIAPALFGNTGLGRFLRFRWNSLDKKKHSGTR